MQSREAHTVPIIPKILQPGSWFGSKSAVAELPPTDAAPATANQQGVIVDKPRNPDDPPRRLVVRTVWQRVVVSKPSVDQLISENRSYLAELTRGMSPDQASQAEAAWREELQRTLSNYRDGDELTVPMVEVE
jgi:hypothetical protein